MYQSKTPHPVDRFLRQPMVALYGFVYAFYFGLVTLDSAYARLLRAELDPVSTDRIFPEISDFLLMPFGLLMLTGAAAFGAALEYPRALYPIMISWLLPVAALGAYQFSGAALDASGFGTVIRLVTAAVGAVLAMLAVSRFRTADFRPGYVSLAR
jgi:hypothetical protein